MPRPTTEGRSGDHRNLAMMPRVWSKRDLARPAGAVYIGRPTKWGNPFVLGHDGTRQQVLDKFRAWVFAPEQDALRAEAQRELRGKDLLCWCAPSPCHGDVWLMIANQDAA
jgi:hypothetical protein